MKRGARVFLKGGSPRNVGTIKSIVHSNAGSFASVEWSNGWWSRLELAELTIAAPAEHPTECDLMRQALKGGD